ncbi:MAG: hypothetical protein ACO4CH_05300 [Saprospiraceae bacterium]
MHLAILLLLSMVASSVQDGQLYQLSEKLVDSRLAERYTYNDLGQLILVEYLNKDGAVSQTRELIHDKAKVSHILRSAEGDTLRMVVHSENSRKEVVKSEIFEPQETTGKLGLIRQMTYDHAPGQVFSVKRILHYDDRGRVDSFQVFHYTDTLGSAVIITYTKGGEVRSTETVKKFPAENPEYEVADKPWESRFICSRKVGISALGRIQSGSYTAFHSTDSLGRVTNSRQVFDNGSEVLITYRYVP